MARPSDRVFHLVVSTFALTLTVASALTLVYQHHPDEVKSWMKPLKQAPWLAQLGLDNVINGTAQPAKPPVTHGGDSGSQTVASQPDAPFQSGDNARLIHVSVHGNDVSDTQLQAVQTLLTKYSIPDVISKSLQLNLHDPVHVYLAQNADDYQSELNSLGVSAEEAKRYSRDTGGFTQGNDIVIPIYQNKADTDMANSLAHELTHAFLNQNVGQSLPSWLNEGTAVTMGMEFQEFASANAVTYEGYARQMEESVLDAARDGKLVPLTADESKVLSGNADYDLELQDWLAVRSLIENHGFSALGNYFHRMASAENSDDVFHQVFGESVQNFNTQFTDLLKSSTNGTDGGVEVQMQFPENFRGFVRVLQHGTQTWDGFRPNAGLTSFTLDPVGQLSGPSVVQSTTDSSPPDTTTTYIDLDPDSAFTYQGQPVENCGFALDYHYGTYAFVNAWITFKNGKSVYIQEPSLFGVSLQTVDEKSQSVLLKLLDTPHIK